jgi:hypothetical protein
MSAPALMRLAVVAAKLIVIAATFVHSRQMRHPHAQCSHFGFHQCRGCARILGRHGVVRLRRPLQRSTADAVRKCRPGNFVRDPVIVRSSCRLIGTYRSIPSCYRLAFLRLVRLLAFSSSLCLPCIQPNCSWLTNTLPVERSGNMNISITVAALIAFILVRSIAPSARPLRKLPGQRSC